MARAVAVHGQNAQCAAAAVMGKRETNNDVPIGFIESILFTPASLGNTVIFMIFIKVDVKKNGSIFTDKKDVVRHENK